MVMRSPVLNFCLQDAKPKYICEHACAAMPKVMPSAQQGAVSLADGVGGTAEITEINKATRIGA